MHSFQLATLSGKWFMPASLHTGQSEPIFIQVSIPDHPHYALTCTLHRVTELWDLGHELFNSSQETFPAHFVGGNAFDPEMLAVAPPASMQTTEKPDLNNLTSLNPLRGHVSAIDATAFFHLFTEDEQLHMARAFAGLLSAEPGSVILGVHTGAREKGAVHKIYKNVEIDMFVHNPESWIAMWDGEVFEKGKVEVEAELREAPAEEGNEPYLFLYWSVTRL